MEAQYPGRWRLAISGEAVDPDADADDSVFGWKLDIDGGVILVRAVQASQPFIWLRGGVAQAIPRTEALALRVAAGNKDLMTGRLYMAYGDDISMIAFDEAIVGAYLSLDYRPSLQDLINRFALSIQYTSEWSKTILEEFGGRPILADDWGLLF